MLAVAKLKGDTFASIVALGARVDGGTFRCERLFVGRSTRAKTILFLIYEDLAKPPTRVHVRTEPLKSTGYGCYKGASFDLA